MPPAGAAAPALRQVTIVFLDVVGSTALASRLDPEDMAERMDGALARGIAVVEAHGGKVLQSAGDSLLAVFGADAAAEDDAERALHAALALRDIGAARAAGDEPLAVRIGVHTGGVLLGGGVNADGTIRGQAVHVAARLEQAAPPGGIRLSHDTWRQVRGLFDATLQPPLPAKGIDAPLVSYLLDAARPRPFRTPARGIEGVETRMIGRDAELKALQAAFAAVAAPGGGPRRVLVTGDAGVGKSRLLDALEDWLATHGRRRFVLRARAAPSARDRPYGLLHDMVTADLQIRDGDDPAAARRRLEEGVMPLFADDESEHEAQAHAHLLGQLIGFDFGASPHVAGIRDDARQIRERGFHAAVESLRRIAARGGVPVVLQLDDLHWSDDASLDFVEHLARRAGDMPLLLLMLARPQLFERRPGFGATADTRIALRALDDDASRRLVDELLQRVDAVPAPLHDLVARGGAGNPYYMEELVKMLVDQGVVRIGDDGRWSVDLARLQQARVPPTLTGVLQARLDGLPAAERGALQLASVVGLTFWDAALRHVEPAATEALPPLQRRELVMPADAPDDGVREYAFGHQLLHQVTYDTVLKRVKRAAHARVADWMAGHAGPRARSLLGAAASHYERAGDAANAAEFHARAAEHMAGLFAHVAALDHAARGLALAVGDAALRWRLLSTRERVLELLGRRDEQRADVDALQALADAAAPGPAGDAWRAEAAWLRADLAHRLGDWPTQRLQAQRALALAERAGDAVLVLRAMQRLAQALAYVGEAAAGRAIAETGLERARALGRPREISRLTNALTVCTDALGDRVAGLRQSLLDLELNRQIGDRRNEAVALSNVGMSCIGFGAFDEAGRHLDDALKLNRRLGNRQIEGNSHAMLSELAWRQGDGAQALRHGDAAWAIAREIGSRLHEADALWSIGNARLALAQPGAAVRAFADSEAVARGIASAAQVLNAVDGQARAALDRGDAAGAARHADRLRAEAGADGLAGTYEHLLRLTLHRAAAAVGDGAAAARLAEAHAALSAEADRIDDAALRQGFLERIDEHRTIVRLAAAANGLLQSAAVRRS